MNRFGSRCPRPILGTKFTSIPRGLSKLSGVFWGVYLWALATSAGAAVGDLDTSFSAGGLVTWDGKTRNVAEGMAVQPDGKILVAGHAGTNSDTQMVVARFHADGRLDKEFGSDGVVYWGQDNKEERALAMAVGPGGKILIGGNASRDGNDDLVLVRLTEDGSLDGSFGSNGAVYWDGGDRDSARAVAFQPDGKALITGSTLTGSGWDVAVVRFTAAGDLDTTFGGDGSLVWGGGNSDYPEELVVQPDGKILVAGHAYFDSTADFLALRITPDGELDTSFGPQDSGVYSYGGDNGQVAHAVALQPDGKILLAGRADSVGTSERDFTLVRLGEDGTQDRDFGEQGVASWGRDQAAEPRALAVQPDGRILVVGQVGSTSGKLAVARFKPDGDLDDSFLSSGLTAWNDATSMVSGVALQPRGRIVAVGTLYDGIPGDPSDAALVAFEGGEWPPITWAEHAWRGADSFSFQKETGVERGTTVHSEAVTVSGLVTGNSLPAQAGAGRLTIQDGSGAEVHSGVSSARVANDYRIRVSHAAAEIGGEQVASKVTVGGVRPPNNAALILGGASAEFTSTANRNPVLDTGSVAMEVAENAPAGTAITTLEAKDPEGQDLTYRITAGNEAGKFSINAATGKMAVADPLDYETPPGEHNLEVMVADPLNGEETASITFTVSDKNDAPLVKDGLEKQTATEDQSFHFEIPDNAFADPDAGDSLSYSVSALPDWLDYQDGAISGTPKNADVGRHAVEVVVSDEKGKEARETLKVVVANTNDPPVYTGGTELKAEAGGSATVKLGGTDPDGDGLRFEIAEQPEHGQVVIEEARAVFKPADGFSGEGSFTVRVADGEGGMDTAQVTVTVAGSTDDGAEKPADDTEEPNENSGQSDGRVTENSSGGGGGGCTLQPGNGHSGLLPLLAAFALFRSWRRRGA